VAFFGETTTRYHRQKWGPITNLKQTKGISIKKKVVGRNGGGKVAGSKHWGRREGFYMREKTGGRQGAAFASGRRTAIYRLCLNREEEKPLSTNKDFIEGGGEGGVI